MVDNIPVYVGSLIILKKNKQTYETKKSLEQSWNIPVWHIPFLQEYKVIRTNNTSCTIYVSFFFFLILSYNSIKLK